MNNILVQLMQSDQNMVRTLMTNQDPKLAETLMEKKLKSVGLTDQEIAILFMKNMDYPLQKALMETGLSEAQLNQLHDGGVAKIEAHLKGPSVLGNIKNIFGSTANSGDLHK